jgi:hypothetical protein
LGYISLAPPVGGNLFSLMFGRNLDAHTQLPVRLLALHAASDHQCFDGRECYVGSLKVTMVACVVSLGLSFWAGVRDERKARSRKSTV